MKKVEKIVFYIFLLIELGLYLSFLIIDFSNFGDSTLIKYISIIIINLFCLISIIFNRNRNYFILFGLIFTLISDTFLLLIDDYYIVGLMCFNLVQSLYYLGLKNKIKKYFNSQLLIRIFILFLCIIISLFNHEYEVMLSISYITFLVLNIASIILFCKKDINIIILLIGLCLFLLCDINVGLNNLGYYFPIKQSTMEFLQNLSSNLMWLFYLPSQVLICIFYFKSENEKNDEF